MTNPVEKQPEFVNVPLASVQSIFKSLATELEKLVSLGGGGAALFEQALKIVTDALSTPPGVGTAIVVLKDVAALIAQGMAAEHTNLARPSEEKE